MSAPIHEVIVGLAGPTRQHAVAEAFAAEQVRRTTECWLIDVYGAHRDPISTYTARSLPEARAMLAGLNTFRPNDRGQDLCITIEDASVVLHDPTIRRNLEDILRGAPTSTIKFRFVVLNLNTASFGGSKTIRDEFANANIVKAVAR